LLSEKGHITEKWPGFQNIDFRLLNN